MPKWTKRNCKCNFGECATVTILTTLLLSLHRRLRLWNSCSLCYLCTVYCSIWVLWLNETQQNNWQLICRKHNWITNAPSCAHTLICKNSLYYYSGISYCSENQRWATQHKRLFLKYFGSTVTWKTFKLYKAHSTFMGHILLELKQ